MSLILLFFFNLPLGCLGESVTLVVAHGESDLSDQGCSLREGNDESDLIT